MVFSQVGIGTTNPNSSSALDITSIDSGLLVPRMSQNQRTNIFTPSKGLLVYQIDLSEGFWYFNGTIWVNLSISTDQDWTISGNNQYSAVTENVGIGRFCRIISTTI